MKQATKILPAPLKRNFPASPEQQMANAESSLGTLVADLTPHISAGRDSVALWIRQYVTHAAAAGPRADIQQVRVLTALREAGYDARSPIVRAVENLRAPSVWPAP